jgi:hypothetical protein
MNRRFLGLALSLGLLVPMVAVAASTTTGVFSDVGDNHLFKADIEAMARAGIAKGDPDGKYHPDRYVNRAEFLKLLYLAAGRIPKSIYVKCFLDVVAGSWYESYVCDAAAKENAFVQGVGNGKFDPAAPVTRTQALKMIFTVFGLDAGDISADDQNLIKFVDVSVTAWYSKYLSAAYKVGVLPVAGEGGARFYPDKELTRGEAAAYIYNGMKVRAKKQESESSASSSSASEESDDTAKRSSSSSSSSAPTFATKDVAFPFSDTDTFVDKKPVNYVFDLTSAKTIASIVVGITGYYQTDVSCRLYLISSSGFSDEYYLGVQTDGKCAITTALKPGKYQLQLQPLAPDASYTVDAAAGFGDSNDGFMEAISLPTGRARTETLDINDLFDWYTFTIAKDRYATVELSPSVGLDCIIYTPSDVDQFGFSGPQCGATYQFAAGTYIIGVGRKAKSDLMKRMTYTILWK